MTAGPVNRTLLESFYQNPGQVYDDGKTEGAFDVIADQVDDNWNYTSALVTANNLTPYPNSQIITNPNMDIWQRGATISVGAAARYGPDRWQGFRDTLATGMTISRQDGMGVVGSNFCARVQRDAANASVATIYLVQPMESTDSIPLRGKQLTISFWARSGANFSGSGANLTLNIISGEGTDQSPVSAITNPVLILSRDSVISGTWTKFTYTSIAIPNTSSQLFFRFSFIPTGVAGANDYFEITQIKVETGTTATPFIPRSFGSELAICLRYFEKSYGYSSAPGAVNPNGALKNSSDDFTNTGTLKRTIKFMAIKRSIPTVSVYGTNGTINTVTDATADRAIVGTLNELTTINGFGVDFTVPTATSSVRLFHYAVDAEI